MRYLITLALFLSLSAHACPTYQKLNIGDKAPCQGHFFNDVMEKTLRRDVRDLNIKTQQLELKDLQLKSIVQDRNKWKDEAIHQSEVSKSKDSDLTKGVLYGVGATILIIFAVGQVK